MPALRLRLTQCRRLPTPSHACSQPVHGYSGFMRNDTAQLEATINVLRTFVDAGVDVWLRFAVSLALTAWRGGLAQEMLDLF